MKIKKGMLVKNEYGIKGIIEKIYNNWDDLKRNNDFITIDPGNEGAKMNGVDKLINGDPRDKWLYQQEKPFTELELKETWFTIFTFNGGSISSCESRLVIINPMLN